MATTDRDDCILSIKPTTEWVISREYIFVGEAIEFQHCPMHLARQAILKFYSAYSANLQ